MTWTYDPSKLGEVDGDNVLTPDARLAGVRLLIGDTDSTDPAAQDEEINYIISRWLPLEGTLEYCAAVLADNLASRYAREVSYSADGVSIGLGAVAQQYRDLANSLRAQSKMMMLGGGPDGGGINVGEGADPTTNPLSFGTQMHDNYEAGRQDFGGDSRPYYVAEEMPGV